MFEYFDKENLYNTTVIDVWKQISFEIEVKDYQLYQIVEGDNLMNISYKFYNTINDWWVIYLFNGLTNINFDLLQTRVLEETVQKHKYLIENYNDLIVEDRKYIENIIRNFYLVENDLITSISKTNDFLSTLDEFEKENIIVYVQDTILIESFYNKELKIPNSNTVLDIKNKMEELSELWNK